MTAFLNPDTTYNIAVSKTGYTSYSASLAPTQNSYTIVLGETTSTNNNYGQGVKYWIASTAIELPYASIIPMNFTITSSYWNIQEFGFRLQNLSGFIYNQTNATTNGGVLNIDFSTGLNSSLMMTYFWIINDTEMNGSRVWLIANTTGDTNWSISTFVTDFIGYLNDNTDADGLFGLKNNSGGNFSLAIIIFMIIFSIAGVMSYKYGLTSSGAIMGVLFTLVLLFDVGLGIMPNPATSVIPHFPTIIMALLLFSILVREALQ